MMTVQKKNVLARGSEWRKWDLQIHTPASHLNHKFGSDWDVYVTNLFRAAIAEEIAVIGLTDYFTIDGYKKIKEEYLSNPEKLAKIFTPEEISKIASIRILPNVEFRLNKFVGENRVNCHVILSDDVEIRDIEEQFLHDIEFTDQAEPQETAEKLKLKVENLRRFGQRLAEEHAPFKNDNPLFLGMKHAVVDDEHIMKRLKDKRFRDKFLFCVVPDEDLSGIGWDSQDHNTRKVLIQRSDALFTSNPKTRSWALAQPPYMDGDEHFIKEFKTLKPCIHGSDCHSYPEIGHPCALRGEKGHVCKHASSMPCQLRYCWIKADTSFEGLRQIVHEPEGRAFIGASPPDYHDKARVLKSITLKDSSGWFVDVEIPLNSGMVSIIGQKGSGKSALADLIAFAAGSWDAGEESSFLNRASPHLDGTQITLHWADDGVSHGVIGEPKNADQEVRYLSQNYVERICAKDGITGELVSEIERVIFHYLDPTDTLGASDFNELRTIKTEGIREEADRLRLEITSVIRDECGLRDLLKKLPEKRTRVKTLLTEQDGLTKQMPKSATPEEEQLLKDLQQKRDALAKVQQDAALLKQKLQKIADIRSRITTFTAQMDRFYQQLEPTLIEVGLPKSEHSKFKPAFANDPHQPLITREAEINKQIATLEGAEPPAAGTIKKLNAEIEALAKRETADKARQERTKQIQTRVAAINTEVARLEVEIKSTDETARANVKGLTAKRHESYVAYFANLKLEQQALQALYEPIRDRLSEQALLKGKELEFSIRWHADLAKWLERGAPLFDQRRTVPYGTYEQLGEEAKRKLLPAWSSGDPEKVKAAIEKFVEEFNTEKLRPSEYMRSGVGLEDLLKWLYEVDHIGLEYGLKFNEAELESLSPGTKGIVLLILYLGLDVADTRPLIVDQPDENLDNDSIYHLLTPYFRNAKVRRQLIVITHNPNLVVNSDSEQVIIAHGEKQANGLPVISYSAGSLENSAPPKTGIRQQVCNILEGGDIAFLKRERRYAIPDQA